MNYYISKTVEGSFDEIENKVKGQLKENGFGVITEIDMQEKLKEKLGVDFKRYNILGACNPGYAHEAIQHEEQLGVLLPCNVVIIDKGDNKVEVAAIDALTMMKSLNNPNIENIADKVNESLKKTLDAI